LQDEDGVSPPAGGGSECGVDVLAIQYVYVLQLNPQLPCCEFRF
jgi:hypothetical protein